MAVPLRAVLEHQMFCNFASYAATWRDQAKVRVIFADILHALTGVLHNTSDRKCSVTLLARRYRTTPDATLLKGVFIPLCKSLL